MEIENAVTKGVEEENEEMEKRGFQRFETVDGAYAAISPSSYKIGQIVNISLGGLVFKYIDRDDPGDLQDTGTLFLGGYGFSVGDLPFHTVDIDPVVEIEGIDFFDDEAVLEGADVPPPLEILSGTAPLDDEEPQTALTMVQQRVEFTELTFKQIFALDKYIRENMRQKDLGFIEVTVEQ